MIVPMKKVFVFMDSAGKSKNLKKLRNIGVLHPEAVKGEGEDFFRAKENLELVQRAYSLIVQDKKDVPENPSQIEIEDGLELANIIINTHDHLDNIKTEIEEIQVQIDEQTIWGDYDPNDINFLRENGVDLKFYVIRSKDFKKLQSSRPVFKVSENGKNTAYVTLEHVTDNFEKLEQKKGVKLNKVIIPDKSLSELKKELAVKQQLHEEIAGEIINLKNNAAELAYAIKQLESRFEFSTIHSGISDDSEVTHMVGYVPVDQVEDFKANADKACLGYAITDPAEDDPVPTKVKNSKIVSIIKPLFDFISIVPGYNEKDVSVFMLPFFSIFFAMIIGDAGYGTLLFLACGFLIIKNLIKRINISKTVILGTWLGFATMVWGAITGNWFASQQIADIAFFKSMIIPAINNWSDDPDKVIKVMMYICFIMGTVHMSIAHIWNVIDGFRKKKPYEALTQMGWFFVIAAMIFVVLKLVVSPEMGLPVYVFALIGVGFLFVVLFSNQEGNFFKGILKGLGGLMPTALDMISAFADTVSYIRLFAVGLASFEIGKAFNGLAGGFLGDGQWYMYIPAILILVFGHSLNIIMGGMSILVHGVRLNVLEFSGHLGMQWTGIKYKPFKEKK
jgi:V/A-type H+-transporting ATPase subunit I